MGKHTSQDQPHPPWEEWNDGLVSSLAPEPTSEKRSLLPERYLDPSTLFRGALALSAGLSPMSSEILSPVPEAPPAHVVVKTAGGALVRSQTDVEHTAFEPISASHPTRARSQTSIQFVQPKTSPITAEALPTRIGRLEDHLAPEALPTEAVALSPRPVALEIREAAAPVQLIAARFEAPPTPKITARGQSQSTGLARTVDALPLEGSASTRNSVQVVKQASPPKVVETLSVRLIGYQKPADAASQIGQISGASAGSSGSNGQATGHGSGSGLPVGESGFAPVVIEKSNGSQADAQASGATAIQVAQAAPAEAIPVSQTPASADTSGNSRGFKVIPISEAALPLPISTPQTVAAPAQSLAPLPPPSRPTMVSGMFKGQKIANEALREAWPTTGHGKQLGDATPAFQSEFNAQRGDLSVDGASDCGEVVAIEVKASGVDPTYYYRGTSHQINYLKAHPEKWLQIPSNTPSSHLKPGDIFVNASHSFIYVGPQPNGHDTVAASLHGHVLEPSDVFYSENGQPFLIFRAVDTAPAPAPAPVPAPVSAPATAPQPLPSGTLVGGVTLPGGSGFTSIGEGFRVIRVVADPTLPDTAVVGAPAVPPAESPALPPSDGGGFALIPIPVEAPPATPVPTPAPTPTSPMTAPPVASPQAAPQPPVAPNPITTINPNKVPQITGDQAANMRMVTSVQFFMGKGLTLEQAAGVVGSFWWESGGDNPTTIQHGDGPGRGIGQWGVNDRWQGVVSLAAQTGRSPYDLSVQNEFAWQELITNPRDGLAALKAASSASEAAKVFEVNFERASTPHMPERITNADTIISAFQAAGVTVAPPNTSAPSAPQPISPPAPSQPTTPTPPSGVNHNGSGGSSVTNPGGSETTGANGSGSQGGGGNGTPTQPGGDSGGFKPTLVNVSVPSDGSVPSSQSNNNPSSNGNQHGTPKINSGAPGSTNADSNQGQGNANGASQNVNTNPPNLVSRILSILS